MKNKLIQKSVEYLIQSFERIELQNEALLSLDEELYRHGSIDSFLSFVCETLATVSSSISCHLLYVVGDDIIANEIDLFGAEIDLIRSIPKNAESGYIESGLLDADNGGFCVINIVAEHSPKILFLLRSDLSSGQSFLYDDASVRTVFKLISDRVRHVVRRRILDSRQQFVSNNLDLFLLQASSKDKIDPLFTENLRWMERRWNSLLKIVMSYWPNWGPFGNHSDRPRYQLLTTEGGGAFFRLRAGNLGEEGEIRFGASSLSSFRLRRDETMCGLFLDRFDSDPSTAYLREDPTEPANLKRYASYLFSSDDIPQSELIIPIFDDGDVVALLNIEHPRKHAFSIYHIDCFLEARDVISPFIKSLIHEDYIRSQREKEFRYVFMRLIRRLSYTQEHRLKNDFSVLMTCLIGMQRAIKSKNYDRLTEELDNTSDITNRMKTVSLDFTRDLSNFITYGKKSISVLIDGALSVIKMERASVGSFEVLSSDNVELIAPDIPVDLFVFASDLAREHIFNVISNAYEEIRLQRRKALDFIGRIEIRIDVSSMKDNAGKETTYELVSIYVSDNGPGVPEELSERIFESGFTTKGSTGGTGFGLAAAKEYMLSIGGSIELVSGDAPGATFALRFPRYVSPYHDELSSSMNVGPVRE